MDVEQKNKNSKFLTLSFVLIFAVYCLISPFAAVFSYVRFGFYTTEFQRNIALILIPVLFIICTVWIITTFVFAVKSIKANGIIPLSIKIPFFVIAISVMIYGIILIINYF